MNRVVSLGLDGAAWHALDPMIEAGELPNLARLVEEGARGTLRSIDPPVTSPAWRCSTSGKNPGKLGVYWWLCLDRATGELHTPDARSFDTADVWDFLSRADHRDAVRGRDPRWRVAGPDPHGSVGSGARRPIGPAAARTARLPEVSPRRASTPCGPASGQTSPPPDGRQ